MLDEARAALVGVRRWHPDVDDPNRARARAPPPSAPRRPGPARRPRSRRRPRGCGPRLRAGARSRRRSRPARNLPIDARPAVVSALDTKLPTSGLDAISEPAQARAVVGRSTAATVVLDLDREPRVLEARRDPRARRAGVLDDVGQRLAGHEVRGALDVGWETTGRRLHIDRKRCAGGERDERSAQTLLGSSSGWMPAARSAAPAPRPGARRRSSRGGGPHPGSRQCRARAARASARAQERRAAVARRHAGLVHPPALLVAGGDDARSRLLDLRELSLHLGMELCVFECESRRGGDRLDELRLVLERRVVKSAATTRPSCSSVVVERPSSGSGVVRPVASANAARSGSQ